MSFVAAGALIRSADARTAFPLGGLAAAKSPLLIEARHRWRRHRRVRPGREHQEEKAASPEKPSVASKPAQPSAPPPSTAQAGKESGKASTPEPMGPPAPPPEWSEAEVQAGRMDCDRRLSGLPILYDRLAPLKEGACGSPAPIRLIGFQRRQQPDVSFSPAPTVSCKLVEALHRWFEDVVQPNAKVQLNASVTRITTLSAYNCRARYDNPSQRLSEHAHANALDISEFITAKGERISVLDHWSEAGERGTFLHNIHEGACEIFGTTLGPEANDAHKNHFHLDMKERRHPLCDFTPEQVRAQKEGKAHAPAPAGAKVPASGSDKPSNPSPQTKIATVPGQTGPGVKPDPADCLTRCGAAKGNAQKQSGSQRCERGAQAALDHHSAEAPRDENSRARRRRHRRHRRYR